MQVGDYVDTLLLPSSGLKNATVRWGTRAGGDHGRRLRPAALPHLAALGRGLHHEDAASGAEVRAPACHPHCALHASHTPHMQYSATGALYHALYGTQ